MFGSAAVADEECFSSTGSEVGQLDRPRRRAVVACMRQCRCSHHGESVLRWMTSGSSGRRETRAHDARRQLIDISVRKRVRRFDFSSPFPPSFPPPPPSPLPLPLPPLPFMVLSE